MRRVLVFLRRGLLLLLALLVVLCAAGWLYLRRSLPELSGVVKVGGLSAPVEVVRDHDGVPHIFAGSRREALYGLGYVHAQDRLWQMDFQRRVGRGRLSQAFGSLTLSADRFMLTLGLLRAAEQAERGLSAEDRALLQAYVDGINAFISAQPASRLPPEFTILRVRPDPWTPADVLTLVKLMALTLSGDFAVETLRTDLGRVVGAERAAQLVLPSPSDDLTIVGQQAPAAGAPAPAPSARAAAGALGQGAPHLAATLQQIRSLLQAGGLPSGVGSNAWVVSGAHSTTGHPLLANDLHLGAQLPSTWYLAHLSAGDWDVVGATIAGLPGVVIGRNRRLAWGITNLFPDTQDLFRERLDASGKQVEFEGRLEPLGILNESIPVKGGQPVAHSVRLTRHGPLISDVNDESSKPADKSAPPDTLALRWTALDPDDTTIVALLRLDQARSSDEFRQALDAFVAPALSFVWASADGDIGFQAAGRFPVRRSGDGSLPAEGWSGANEWVGWVPPEGAPRLLDPPEGLVVSANNRPVPPDYPHYLGSTWEKPYRARRIRELLAARPKLSPQDMAAIQGDTVSLYARELLPELIALAEPKDESERAALDLLRRFDGDMTKRGAAAAVFAAWCRRLPAALLADELGADLARRYAGWTDLFVSRFLVRTLARRDDAWCDNVATSGREDCAWAVGQALHGALGDLDDKLGSKREAWRWERLHHAVFSHVPFGSIDFVRALFNRSIATGGDTSTVNLGQFGTSASFSQQVVASYRQVIDVADLDSGLFILAIGQSGNPLSPHYDDYLEDWGAARYRPMRIERTAVLRDQAAVLRLEP